MLIYWSLFAACFVRRVPDVLGIASCDQGWTMNDSSCYYLGSPAKTWNQSQTACLSKGANLVIIDTPDENAFLQKLLRKDPQNHWTAGNDMAHEGQWMWEDTPRQDAYGMDYTNWQQGEPNTYMTHNEDCVEIYASGHWNDEMCTAPRHFICENISKEQSDETKVLIFQKNVFSGQSLQIQLWDEEKIISVLHCQ